MPGRTDKTIGAKKKSRVLGRVHMLAVLVPHLAVAPVAGASLPTATWCALHVDGALLVVDKGAGLLTVPGIGEAKADCLLSRLADAGHPEVGHAAHRLDRDTSGVLALGRTPAAHRSLCVQFQERRASKRYEALVLGWPHEEAGEVDEEEIWGFGAAAADASSLCIEV